MALRIERNGVGERSILPKRLEGISRSKGTVNTKAAGSQRPFGQLRIWGQRDDRTRCQWHEPNREKAK